MFDKNILPYFLAGLFLSVSNTLHAEPKVAKIFLQENSKCTFKRSAGEYPDYVLFVDGKKVFTQPEALGEIVFSKNGKYLAFGDSEITPIALGEKGHHLYLINCETGKYFGYFPLKSWEKNQKGESIFIQTVSPVQFGKNDKTLEYRINYRQRVKDKEFENSSSGVVFFENDLRR